MSPRVIGIGLIVAALAAAIAGFKGIASVTYAIAAYFIGYGDGQQESPTVAEKQE